MKIRPIVLVVVTLTIGILLGMLISGQLRSYRLKPVKAFFSEEKFREAMYSAIQPSDDQKVKIDAILEKYSKLNGEAASVFRKEFESRMEKFRGEIDSILTHEQLVRMKELDEQRQRMVKSGRREGRSGYHDPGRKQRYDSLHHEACDTITQPPGR